jgi:mono/diheme cytochrome c family protein
MSNRFLPAFSLALFFASFSARMLAADATNPPPATPIIANLSPEEEARTFFFPEPGYHLECVLSEPIIKEPVLTVFDGNGRMYVAEMRSFMQDIDGNNQRARNSRVSLHWSSKNNGVYDKHSVFVDNLCLPRMVLPMDGGVLINETDSDDIWLYRDTKGTGVADQKVLFSAGGPRGGNLEHQPGGLIYDLDNWMYMSVNAYRLRVKGTNVLRENTPANFGQWGLTQDDYGKPWFSNAGFESGPVRFQTPIIYGAIYYDDEFEKDYQVVWPLIGLPDMQGGPDRIRPDAKSLNHFTSTCGQEIYRGDRLPADLRGDQLMAEPVGRLIRRTRIEVREGATFLRNAYDKTEFIRSTDPDFRPVFTANAPDGTLYITDMYRGIIQEKEWVNPGSYIRGVIQQYHLDQNIGRGRIWRLVHDSMKPGPQPHMLDETPAKLVQHLAHLNGWWRDTAQKLLVLRGDRSVVPALMNMARFNTNHLARLQALWTIEGLDALTPALVLEKLKDPHPQLRVAAIRVSEDFYKKGDRSLLPSVCTLTNDHDPNVVIQLMLSANLLKWPGWDNLLRATVAANHALGVQRIGGQIAPPPPPVINPLQPAPPSPPPLFTAEEQQILERGQLVYNQLCFACHAPDGKGTPLKPGATIAPPLSGSATATGYRDGVISVVLKGLHGAVDGKTYEAQMVPMESNNDDWIASVISYVRNNFGNHSTFITSNDVARVRAAINSRTNTWTIEELHDILPQPLTNRREWKLTASHNPASLPLAVDGNLLTRYNTGRPQASGMWVQVELPEAAEIAGIELNSGMSTNDFPRGYKVELSTDGVKWLLALVTEHSSALRNQILFPPITAKFIRVTLTASDPNFPWSIHEMQILKVSPPELFKPPDLLAPMNEPPSKPAISYE